MWGLAKPSVEDSLSDVELFGDKGIIAGNDIDNLKTLVVQYDDQQGSVTDTQHKSVSEVGANKIRKAYDATYEGKKFYNLRESLLENVYKCPCCSIGFPDTLDHYMPKGVYKALSLCRQNLVPMCSSCNNKKKDGDYYKFIHPYYISTSIPREVFLEAKLYIIDSVIAVQFNFIRSAFDSEDVYKQFVFHWDNLNLNKRLQKSVIDYMQSVLPSVSIVEDSLLTRLEIVLSQCVNHYGLNDWRSAVIRALIKEIHTNGPTSLLGALAKLKSRSKDVLY